MWNGKWTAELEQLYDAYMEKFGGALPDGKLEEFKTLMEETGFPDLFVCYDQGYSEFMASLDAYEEVSEKTLYIGLAGFSVVMLLFLFLYPAQQKRALRLMGALGASWEENQMSISLDNVSYSYKGKFQTVKAVDGVSYDFEPGKCYAIIGKFGSGKTTLLSLMAGLDLPTDCFRC